MIDKTLFYRYPIFAVCCIAYFFAYFHRTSPAAMAPEIVGAFQVTPVALGFFGSMYFYAYALGQLPAGLLADHWGPRKTMGLFVLIAAIGSMVFAWAPNFNIALIGRFLVGLGVGFIYVPTMRILADWFKTNEFATCNGILAAIGNVGSLASTAPLVFMMAALGWREVMFLIGVVSMMIAVLCYLIIKNKPEEIGGAKISEIEGLLPVQPPTSSSLSDSLKTMAKNYNVWAISVLMVITAGTEFGFVGLWVGPYLTNVYGLGMAETSKIISAIPLGMIVGCPLIGVITDKFMLSQKRVIITGCFAYILTWVPLIWMIDSISTKFITLLLFLFGFSLGVITIMYANLKENVSLSITGTAIGLVNMLCFLLGGALFQQLMSIIIAKSPVINGVIAASGFKSAFIFCFVAQIIALAFFSTQKPTPSC